MSESNIRRMLKSLKHTPRRKGFFQSPNYIRLRGSKLFRGFFGNLEFMGFMGVLSFGLYYISKHKESFSETSRLISCGIATHLIVDFMTYFGDKINTEVKVESFKPIKTKPKDYISSTFKSLFLHDFKSKRKIKQSLFSHYITTYKGIQAGVLYLTFNSVFFYGLYKNLKHTIKDKFHIEGFLNFFLAAGLAQTVAMTFSFPFENLKTRMQASNFTYDTLTGYYKKLIGSKNMNVIKHNIMKEYSGFFSHLILYVLFEALTFGTYESVVAYLQSNKILESDQEKKEDHHHKQVNIKQILVAGSISAIVAGVLTNPIDVYQINKQMNPSFSMSEINSKNLFVGVKERVYYILLLNIFTFFFLEKIGPGYYDVRLEDDS